MSTKVNIIDFDLFHEVIKSATKLVESAKITIDQNGMSIYGSAKDRIARCELTSNAVTADQPSSFSILKMPVFLKVIQTIHDVHGNDYSGLDFTIDLPFVKFSSKKFKTKLSTCDEDTIGNWIARKIEVTFEPLFEFMTTSDLIKQVNGHSYIFEDIDSLRIYIETKPEMENNAVYATIGNKQASLSNEMTLKFGLLTLKEDENQAPIIIDLPRLNLFNALPSSQIRMFLPKKYNSLVCDVTQNGKNGTFFKLMVCSSTLKS